MPFKKAIERAEAIEELLLTAVETFIKDNEGFVLGLNAKQLDEGKRSDGKPFLKRYAESTIKTKKRKGQQIKPPNLKDTGGHRESWFIEYQEDEFDIVADYGKVGAILEGKYGAEILGISEDSKKDFNKMFIPFLEQKIKEINDGQSQS